ncbi:isochorismate synthase [Pseudoalteromonas sp. S16_S37]|uniref:isochorismate synthase n=1 Tax=Pseudoalteromonas sp. S16_S37 TaxID=2720228 RepID=UPI0016810163|nr:isochorismate synthase [Pseudoalteromonas sp. S16_S37]MBD1583969.1 isochorismate synthase [Pseudoalteromonas sp. S16_S37]
MLSELTALQSIDTSIGEFDASKHALFAAGSHCYITHHPQHRFTAGIEDHEALAQRVTRALAQNENDNAIAFGVLPFCKSQQAQFIIADQVRKYDKETFTRWLSAKNSLHHPHTPNLERVVHRQSQQHYEHAINRAKGCFASGLLEKIVLAKQSDLYFDDVLQPDVVLADLLTQSSSGFHFSFPTEQRTTLMGVSPELLLRKQGQSIMSNPLAGSTKRVSDMALEFKRKQALMASKKDRYEHAVVLAEMSQVLQPWCDKLSIPSSPSLLSTATMWHLSTVIEGQLKNPDTHVLSLANRLHPTPALCGKPTAAAYPWIETLEGESRGFFSGIVGWCDKQGNGEWVVVIRCGELNDNHAKLFAGAGIVAASDPTSEWFETEAKMSTMLNALNASERYHQLSQTELLESA